MKLWITVDQNDYVTSFSTVEQSGQIEVEVEKIPEDFTNWKYDGTSLIHDPENAPTINESLTETELLRKENEELKRELDVTKEDLTNTQLGLAEVYEIVLGGGVE